MIESAFESSGPVVITLLVLAFIFAFCNGFGMGANDLSNSFSAVFGSKVLSIKQIIIVAGIFELLGAILIGQKVSETLQKGMFKKDNLPQLYNGSTDCWSINYQPNIDLTLADDTFGCPHIISIIGSVSTLLSSSIWMLIATLFGLPVSSSHSIVGSLIGYGCVALGFKFIDWSKLGLIILSWFISPLMSGVLTAIVYYCIVYFICQKPNSYNLSCRVVPFIYSLLFLIYIFAILYDGSKILYFDLIPWWGALIASSVIAAIVYICANYFLIPYQKRTADNIMNKQEYTIDIVNNTDNNIEITITPPLDVEFKDLTASESVKTKKMPQPRAIFETAENGQILYLFRYLQVISSCYMAFSHGGNDVGNAVSQLINTWIIYKEKHIMAKPEAPIWILIYGGCSLVIGLALLGSRVLNRLANDITKLNSISGFSIEFSTVSTVLLMSKLGAPISTTHCITGSIVAIGLVRCGYRSLDVKILSGIAFAWLVTVPFSAVMSACIYLAIQAIIFKT